MKSLNFDTGIKTYCINDDESKVIAINVKDTNIMSRALESQKELENIKDKYQFNNEMTSEEQIQTYKKIGEEISKQIDYIFNAKVADVVFGDTNPLATVNGKPLFQLFLESILPDIESEIKKEQKKANEYINKYMAQVKEFK